MTESLALNRLPGSVRTLCRLADISAKSRLLQGVRQEAPEKLSALIERIAGPGSATRQQLREAIVTSTAAAPNISWSERTNQGSGPRHHSPR